MYKNQSVFIYLFFTEEHAHCFPGCMNGGMCRRGKCRCPHGFSGGLCQEGMQIYIQLYHSSSSSFVLELIRNY